MDIGKYNNDTINIQANKQMIEYTYLIGIN